MRPALLSVLLALAACGARSSTPAPDVDVATGGAAGSGGAAPRSCAPNCTIGHQCCLGGCDGPAVETPNDCCVCLPGEVNSSMCAGGVCGG